ncbi:MAG TPA: zinc-ribbon domain-containing protein [Streptosporangiaceae bacterium]|nr:zinc-ribbon domain-containing protein [Streptosporangiaceae bacterium]
MPHPADPERPDDWYSVLGVDPVATTDQIAAAVERRARQANALAVTAPERARQLRDQVRAIKQDLLSGAEQRERYDQRLARQEANAVPSLPPARTPAGYPAETPAGQPAPAPPSPHGPAAGGQPLPQAGSSPPPGAGARGLMSRVAQFLRTGWTCSNCGYGALPTDKFCPKCGSKIQPGLGGRAAADSHPDMAPPSEAPAAQPAPCGKCGGMIAPGDAFCTRCGALRA